jgi:serine/threonine protein kinase
MSLQRGMQLRNYRVEEILAEGGMGVVWRAWDVERNEPVAIKAVANDLINDPHFKERFLHEVARHARLNHPNIVPVLDVFETNGQSCFVMKLIDGESLADLLENRKHNRLGIKEALPIMRDTLDALNYAHQQGILHRDVKPSNILLDRDHRAYLIDFGIALAIGEQRLTRAGQTLGTPLYMSPEQIKGEEIFHVSDVYSVGCVFYEMLTGRPPFLSESNREGDTDFLIKHAHVTETPVRCRQRVRSISHDIDDIIMAALEKDPEKRIPGCQEFCRLLDHSGTFSVGAWTYAFAAVVALVLLGALIAIMWPLWFTAS